MDIEEKDLNQLVRNFLAKLTIVDHSLVFTTIILKVKVVLLKDFISTIIFKVKICL